MSNRVEHQKLNQVGAGRPPPGWVFGVQLGLRQTQALIKTKNIRRRKVPPAILLLCRKHYYSVVKLLQSSNITSGTFLLLIFLSWSVPVSAEGRVEHQKLNQVGAARPPPGWVFGFQLDSLHGFPRQAGHFFSGMSNRVEHQKLNQVGA